MSNLVQYFPADQWAECIAKMPLVSMDLIVSNDQGAVLVGFRRNRPAQHTRFVPGGVVRKNERLSEAFQHVVLDELGIQLPLARAHELRVKAFAGVFEHHYPDNFLNDLHSTHYVVLAHRLLLADLFGLGQSLCSLDLPKAQHTEYRWMKPTELLDEDAVHENTKAYFRSHSVR